MLKMHERSNVYMQMCLKNMMSAKKFILCQIRLTVKNCKIIYVIVTMQNKDWPDK